MTRTERAASIRAVLKDRSESKSGRDKSFAKEGAGSHNWGSLKDELAMEREALEDEPLQGREDYQAVRDVADGVNQAIQVSIAGPVDDNESEKSSGSPTEEEREKAREFRAKGLKGDIDLTAIARSSAGASTSPPKNFSIRDTRNMP